jgi:hypothetical protein
MSHYTKTECSEITEYRLFGYFRAVDSGLRALVLSAAPNRTGGLDLSFGTQSGFNYTELSADKLAGSAWTEVSTVAGDGSIKTISALMAGPSRFYRLQVH